MIQVAEEMFSRRASFHQPRFDIEKIPTALFGMGFDREFIGRCEYPYGWNFASLFPALYDGTFYQNPVVGAARGQGDLRGFATFLCGLSAQYPESRTDLDDAFERSLLSDGYRFTGKELVEISIDTFTSRELEELPNRRCLLQELSSQLQSNELVAVLFVDIDAFKEVNDRLGHREGDNCLIAVSRVITMVIRQKGRLYRVGGDEFCVMLPNFPTSEALATAERIRASIDDFKPFGGVVKITTSIGVAVSDGQKLATSEALIKAADEAMYVSKFTGKNRTSRWPVDAKEAAQAETNRKKTFRTTA